MAIAPPIYDKEEEALTFGEEEAMEIGTIEALMVEEETAGDMIVMEVGDGKADIHHLEMVIDIERHHMEMIVVMKAKGKKYNFLHE